MILVQGLFLSAHATTWAPPPPTLAEQLAKAELACELRVRDVQTVVLDDGFPTSHVTLEAMGGSDPVQLILPGGVVDGTFMKGAPGSFQVQPGEMLYLMLEPAVGVPGFRNVAHGFRSGVFRQVDGRIEDVEGNAIVGLPCDGKPVRSRAEPGMLWGDAMKALATCGGVR